GRDRPLLRQDDVVPDRRRRAGGARRRRRSDGARPDGRLRRGPRSTAAEPASRPVKLASVLRPFHGSGESARFETGSLRSRAMPWFVFCTVVAALYFGREGLKPNALAA